MDTRDDLIILIDRYKKASGLADATISTRVFKDGKRVTRMRAGARIYSDTCTSAIEKLKQLIASIDHPAQKKNHLKRK